MMDIDRKFRGGILGEFFTHLILVAHQNHLHSMLLGRKNGSFDNVSRGKIPSHSIHSDLHFTLSLYPVRKARDLFLFLHLDDLFPLVSSTMGTDMMGE
jgi:hypothetical protein